MREVGRPRRSGIVAHRGVRERGFGDPWQCSVKFTDASADCLEVGVEVSERALHAVESGFEFVDSFGGCGVDSGGFIGVGERAFDRADAVGEQVVSGIHRGGRGFRVQLSAQP